MDPIALTTEWSDPITTPARAVLQNNSFGMVHVKAASAAPTHAALRIPPGEVYRLDDGAQIVARVTSGTGQLGVMVGL